MCMHKTQKNQIFFAKPFKQAKGAKFFPVYVMQVLLNYVWHSTTTMNIVIRWYHLHTS